MDIIGLPIISFLNLAEHVVLIINLLLLFLNGHSDHSAPLLYDVSNGKLGS